MAPISPRFSGLAIVIMTIVAGNGPAAALSEGEADAYDVFIRLDAQTIEHWEAVVGVGFCLLEDAQVEITLDDGASGDSVRFTITDGDLEVADPFDGAWQVTASGPSLVRLEAHGLTRDLIILPQCAEAADAPAVEHVVLVTCSTDAEHTITGAPMAVQANAPVACDPSWQASLASSLIADCPPLPGSCDDLGEDLLSNMNLVMRGGSDSGGSGNDHSWEPTGYGAFCNTVTAEGGGRFELSVNDGILDNIPPAGGNSAPGMGRVLIPKIPLATGGEITQKACLTPGLWDVLLESSETKFDDDQAAADQLECMADTVKAAAVTGTIVAFGATPAAGAAVFVAHIVVGDLYCRGKALLTNWYIENTYACYIAPPSVTWDRQRYDGHLFNDYLDIKAIEGDFYSGGSFTVYFNEAAEETSGDKPFKTSIAGTSRSQVDDACEELLLELEREADLRTYFFRSMQGQGEASLSVNVKTGRVIPDLGVDSLQDNLGFLPAYGLVMRCNGASCWAELDVVISQCGDGTLDAATAAEVNYEIVPTPTTAADPCLLNIDVLLNGESILGSPQDVDGVNLEAHVSGAYDAGMDPPEDAFDDVHIPSQIGTDAHMDMTQHSAPPVENYVTASSHELPDQN